LNAYLHLPPAEADALAVAANEQQRRAFAVVDAINALRVQLGALRAVAQLTTNEQLGSEEALPQVRRSDLALLLRVLDSDLGAHCETAHEAALLATQGIGA
jgi:uncharacterized membrane protein